MSDASTTHMIERYMEEAEAPMFLSGYFRSPPRNFHTTEEVEIDVEREDEDVAIVIQDLSSEGRHNKDSVYTNKSFIPPLFKEVASVQAYKLIKRVPGQNPFTNPDFGAAAADEAFRKFRKLDRKIRRAVELMSSQVLQTGVLTLIDDAGNALYTLDFQPKTTHITTVGTTWATDGSTGDPLANLEATAEVVRADGKSNPVDLIFGTSAMQRFLINDNVKDQLDNRIIGPGTAVIQPQRRGQGATFRGTVWVGHYQFNLFMYNGHYKHPQTGVITPYVSPNNVIMLPENPRFDLTFGGIPMFINPEQRALPFLPPRMSSTEMGLDMTVNAWVTPNGESLMVSAGTRPLTIPTAIDTYACLTVVQE